MCELIKKTTKTNGAALLSWLLCLGCLCCFSLSCSEDDGEDDEYANWQERNDDAVNRWAANASMRKVKCFTKDPETAGASSDYIYVEVLESGSGTESPFYTDTVWVAYRGHLIPTASHADGYVFDETYKGDFDWKTAGVSQFTVAGLVEGFSTALMEMRPGDHWRVHIPYMLGYGATKRTSIPAYSDLTFDIALFDFWHPGENRPVFKARAAE